MAQGEGVPVGRRDGQSGGDEGVPTRRRVGERRPRDGYESENEETILVEDTLDLSDAASRERLSRYRVTSSEMALVHDCFTAYERKDGRWCGGCFR